VAPPKKKAAKKAAPARKAAGPAKKRVAAQPTRREKEARALRNRIVIGGLLLVLAGAVVFFAARPDAGPSTPELIEAGPGGCDYDTEFDGDASNQGDHVTNPTYDVDPPAGGPHLATAANPGFYRPGQAPPDGQLVHAQEHGFVILWYRPDLPDEKITQLEQLSDQFGRELLFVPRESLTGEIAVTAWHKRMRCQQLVPEQVERFTRAYVDQGPEKGFL
jgi:hypothetical protein